MLDNFALMREMDPPGLFGGPQRNRVFVTMDSFSQKRFLHLVCSSQKVACILKHSLKSVPESERVQLSLILLGSGMEPHPEME